ncbi:phosphotransferase enzyme family protein [Candidatus Xianfuyuplasma coldseepsis]|uniref:Phosphotransferase n=1 Tax=Candidatus Xianfuyuplasma coldseepsis TaxID=2782163 RepID=A0A7L7KPA1_9MOLU|nr:phosphotransferase [Xianfuyuplasma coldseepsis]QMS84487.1 phosphotransferase [Xianfuyuplasma coldseepsis]
MEQYMQQELTDKIIEQAAILYDADPTTITKIGGFENFVYEYHKNKQDYILRFVHSGHRTYDLVLAEIEFIDYLDHHDARVSTVVHSIHDKIAEKITINSEHYFTVSVFEKARGDLVKNEDLTAEFYQMFGREVGKLHRLTKTFNPKHKRPQWYEENFSDIANKYLQYDSEIIDLYQQVEATIKSLPKSIDNYGLIHTDLHFGNMFYDGEKLTFFDFDDSAYKHFLSDIAIIIFYHFRGLDNRHEKYNEKVRFILHNVMKGYQLENMLDLEFFKHLNEFLLLRSVILYVVMTAAGFDQHENPRYREVHAYRREASINNWVAVDLDYVLEGL